MGDSSIKAALFIALLVRVNIVSGFNHGASFKGNGAAGGTSHSSLQCSH
jgi:hypothetical protein